MAVGVGSAEALAARAGGFLRGERLRPDMRVLRGAVYGVRFLLELAALVALGFWGVQTGTSLPAQVALGLAAPLFAAGVWGTFVAPKARYRLPGPARLGLELLVFGATALALVDVGLFTAAGVVAGFAVVTSGATFVLERRDGGQFVGGPPDE